MRRKKADFSSLKSALFNFSCLPELRLGIRLHTRANQFLKQVQHFPRLGVPAECFFGKNAFPINFDVKNPFGAGNKRELVNNVLIIAENVFRHTDGARTVVSRHAVFEADIVFFIH